MIRKIGVQKINFIEKWKKELTLECGFFKLVKSKYKSKTLIYNNVFHNYYTIYYEFRNFFYKYNVQ